MPTGCALLSQKLTNRRRGKAPFFLVSLPPWRWRGKSPNRPFGALPGKGKQTRGMGSRFFFRCFRHVDLEACRVADSPMHLVVEGGSGVDFLLAPCGLCRSAVLEAVRALRVARGCRFQVCAFEKGHVLRLRRLTSVGFLCLDECQCAARCCCFVSESSRFS